MGGTGCENVHNIEKVALRHCTSWVCSQTSTRGKCTDYNDLDSSCGAVLAEIDISPGSTGRQTLSWTTPSHFEQWCPVPASCNWSQLGADIDGEAALDQSGDRVSLSSDGRTVAIGAHGNDGNGADSGHVRIYSYDGTAWVQQGADIDGEAAGDYSGHSSVSLSSDGSTV